MLDMNKSRIHKSTMHTLGSSVSALEEGLILAASMEGGRQVVGPALGVSGEVLVGFSRSAVQNPTTAKRVERVTVPASGAYTVTLGRTPKTAVASNMSVALVTAGVVTSTVLTVVTGTPASATEVKVVGTTMTFHADDAGLTYQVTYSYDLTVSESSTLFGDSVNDGGQTLVGGVDVIEDAPVLYTTCYDPTDNWAVGGQVYADAGGILTLKSTTNTALPAGCRIVEAPSAASPALGIRAFF